MEKIVFRFGRQGKTSEKSGPGPLPLLLAMTRVLSSDYPSSIPPSSGSYRWPVLHIAGARVRQGGQGQGGDRG